MWYEDSANESNVDVYVKFNINNSKNKQIKGAENVQKDKSGKILVRGSLLTTVALFASSLLVFADILEYKR